MSYGIGFHIKHVNNADEVLALMSDISKEESKIENAIKKIDADRFWVLRNYRLAKEMHLVKPDSFVVTDFFITYLQSLFTNRFYYWKEYNIVGYLYMSTEVPDYMQKYFDGYVYFQNSCDQDYDYEDWTVLGDWVKPIINDVSKMSPEEVYNTLYDWEPSDNEEITNYEYNKRSLVYDHVESKLEIENILDAKFSKDNTYQCFEMTKFFKGENYLLRTAILKYLEEKLIEEDEEDARAKEAAKSNE